MKKSTLALLSLAFLISASTGSARAADEALPKVQEATLHNGMKLLVLERHESPTVAFHVAYDVGSAYDVPGKTGLAHLFEHMIFKGTRNLNTRDYKSEKKVEDKIERAGEALIAEQEKAKPDPDKVKALKDQLDALQKEADRYIVHDEYERIYTQNGAAHFNAFTAPDETAYVVSLPSNKVGLWMAMEADRFRSPVLREFYRERNVVMEERRMNYESAPNGMLWQAVQAAAFWNSPYHNEGIGWMSDIRSISRAETEDFFKKYYTPSSAVVAIVGDVNAAQIIAQAQKMLGGLPSHPPPKDEIPQEPEQHGERRVTVHFDAEPRFVIAYKKKSYQDADQAAVEMIDGVLSMGRTSRFYKHLVEGKKLAQSVGTSTDEPGRKYPGLFVIFAEPRRPATVPRLEAAIYEELRTLEKDGPTEWELEKVRNNEEASLVRAMDSNEGMAGQLADDQAVVGDWRDAWNHVAALKKVTAEDVKRVAEELFDPDRRTVAVLERPESRTAEAKAAPEEAR